MNDLFTRVCELQNLKIAFERVAENHGCRGSDGVTISEFHRSLNANLQELGFDLAQQRYHPWPLLRFPIPKRAGGQSIANDWELPTCSHGNPHTCGSTGTADRRSANHGYGRLVAI